MPDEALKAGTAGAGAPGIGQGQIAKGAIDWLGRVRALAPRIAAAAAEIEHEQRLPERLVADFRAAGLFSLLIPRPFNGAEIDPPTFAAILEAIAAIDASTAWCLGQNNVCASVAAFLPTEAAQEIFGGEPQAILAWGAGYGGKAVSVEGGYRVSGKWSFTSGGHHATWLGAHCVVSEADGRERRGPEGKPVTRTMLFPATETSLQEIWHVIGLRGTGSDAYAVENLFVPEAHSLARDEPAERRYSGPLYHYSSNSLFASGFAGVALGIARAMLDALIALAKEKTSRGLSNPMRLSPVSQYRDRRGGGAAPGRTDVPDGHGLGSLAGGAAGGWDHARAAHRDPACGDARDPRGDEDRGLRLFLGRGDGDLRDEPVRAAVPRYSRGGAAIAGAGVESRDRGPVPARRGARYDVRLTPGVWGGSSGKNPDFQWRVPRKIRGEASWKLRGGEAADRD